MWLQPAFLLIASLGQTGQSSDSVILSTSIRERIAAHRPDQYEQVEREYAIALGEKLNREIPRSADAKQLNNLQILFANITKGASRIGDYRMASDPNGRLIQMKAQRLCNQVMLDILRGRCKALPNTQATVWQTFRRVKAEHEGRADQIKAYADTGLGYSVDQFWIEYNSLGSLIERVVVASSLRSKNEKSAIFEYCEKVINLSFGVDPDPY